MSVPSLLEWFVAPLAPFFPECQFEEKLLQPICNDSIRTKCHKAYFDPVSSPNLFLALQKTLRVITTATVAQYVHFSTSSLVEAAHNWRTKLMEKRCFFPRNFGGKSMHSLAAHTDLLAFRKSLHDHLNWHPPDRPCVTNWVNAKIERSAKRRVRSISPKYIARRAQLKRLKIIRRRVQNLKSIPTDKYVKGDMMPSEGDLRALISEAMELQQVIEASKPKRASRSDLKQQWEEGDRDGLWLCPGCDCVFKKKTVAQATAHQQTKKCLAYVKEQTANRVRQTTQ